MSNAVQSDTCNRNALPPRWDIDVVETDTGWGWRAWRNGVLAAAGWYRGGTRAQAELYAKRHAQEWAGATRGA